jgi:hypothetical protein
MDTDTTATRSRRALLTAAAGAAGAMVASAALPLGVAAHDADDIQKEIDNPTTAQTTVTNSGTDGTALAGHATGTGAGYGLEGTAAGGAGVFAWSVDAPDSSWFSADLTAYTGVFGSAPASPDPTNFLATGVWGDSPDIGVLGTGGNGVVGFGGIGVEGDANTAAGAVGVWAYAPTNAQWALRVSGKVNLSRSGRVAMSSGTSYKSVALAGVTTTSKVFAVFSTSESGRWVRAVVPSTNKFTIYLNTTLSSSAVVSWFVLD